MKEKIFHILKLLSVPIVLVSIYLSMYLIWRLFALPTDDQLVVLVKNAFDTYGLWIVFLSALIEGFLLLGQYFPGGTVIFLGVISAGNDIHSVVEVVIVVSIAFIISYTLNYLIGKYGWYKLIVKFGLLKSIENAKNKLSEKGLSAVIFSYWEPNLASLTATAAGILEVSMKKFQIHSILGVLFWNTFWATLVFFLGSNALKVIGLKYVLVIFTVWVFIILLKNYIDKRRLNTKF